MRTLLIKTVNAKNKICPILKGSCVGDKCMFWEKREPNFSAITKHYKTLGKMSLKDAENLLKEEQIKRTIELEKVDDYVFNRLQIANSRTHIKEIEAVYYFDNKITFGTCLLRKSEESGCLKW